MRVRGKALEMMLHVLVQQFVLGQQIGKLPQLRAGRQLAP